MSFHRAQANSTKKQTNEAVKSPGSPFRLVLVSKSPSLRSVSINLSVLPEQQTRIAFFIRRIRYRFRGQCDLCILSETLLQIPETMFSFGSQQRVVNSTLNPFQKTKFAVANLHTFLVTGVARCRVVTRSINLDDEKKSFRPGVSTRACSCIVSGDESRAQRRIEGSEVEPTWLV